MEVIGDYHKDGFSHLRGLIPKEVARAYMTRLKAATAAAAACQPTATLSGGAFASGFRREFQVVQPMDFFLWGLTPIMERVVGRELSRPINTSASIARATYAASIQTGQRASTASR